MKFQVPSKHVTGADYINSNERQLPQAVPETTKRKAGPPTELKPEKFEHKIKFSKKTNSGEFVWQSMSCPILQLFY